MVDVVVLRVGHGLHSCGESAGREGSGEPWVELFQDVVLADIDAAGVGDAVGVGVLGGVGAAVVVAVVVEAADPAPLADAAAQEAGQHVVALAGTRLSDPIGAPPRSGD
ncbi:hypothetical protein ABT339_28885 [Micromonospora sp. NPDC000119]|uniref:hypothetical protein n=1 Tax=unclassified Micromonospora TaxID=2617518 RepID=UPI003320255C